MKAVVHVADRTRWSPGLRSGRALVKAGAEVVLVADGDAASLCLECHQDPMKAMKQLIIDGAEIRICEASLRAAKQDPAGVPDYLKLVASGAVELVRLQEAGFAYLRA